MAHEFYDNPTAHPYADLLRTQTVTLIGGGGGNSKAAEALYPYVGELNVITAVTDSGGAAQKNAEENGHIIAGGDISRVAKALSPYKKQLSRFDGDKARFGEHDDYRTVRGVGRQMIRDLLTADHEFDIAFARDVVEETAGVAARAKGGPHKRKLGGMMLTAMMSPYGMRLDANTATASLGEIVGAQGHILAVSEKFHHLVLDDIDENGKPVTIYTEDEIDRRGVLDPMNAHLYFDRPVTPNPKAVAALKESHNIFLAQGSPWGSPLPPAIALKDTLADLKVGGILNLIEDNGTRGLTADQHIDIVRRHTGVPLDYVIYNTNTAVIPAEDMPVQGTPTVPFAIKAELAGNLASYSANDAVAAAGLRSSIETDPRALALAMMDLEQAKHEAAIAAH